MVYLLPGGLFQAAIIEALKDGGQLPLDGLLLGGRDMAARLESATRRLRSVIDEWRQTPWQLIRPHASHDDGLLRRASAALLALRNDLRDLDQHLAEARKASPDARVLHLGHRLELWRRLLLCCRANDIPAFLTLTAAHDWLTEGSPAVAAKRALVSGGSDSPAWREHLRKAEALANGHAYPQTPEWKRVHANQLELGRSLKPLVRHLEARFKNCSETYDAARAAHEETIHQGVVVAQRETVGRLEESIHAAGLRLSELEGVDRRESEALQALNAPGRAVSESLPFTSRVPPLLTDQDINLAMIWAGAAGGTSYHEEQMRSARQAELTGC